MHAGSFCGVQQTRSSSQSWFIFSPSPAHLFELQNLFKCPQHSLSLKVWALLPLCRGHLFRDTPLEAPGMYTVWWINRGLAGPSCQKRTSQTWGTDSRTGPWDEVHFRPAGWRRRQTCFVKFWDQAEDVMGWGKVAVWYQEVSNQQGEITLRVVSFLFSEKNKQNLNGLDSGARRQPLDWM